MIIKRKLKSPMPGLKRCKLGHSRNGEDDPAATRKRRRVDYGYYPLSLLGEVAAGVIPLSLLSSGEKGISASWCTEVSCSPGETGSDTKVRFGMSRGKKTAEVSRPPLVRTSRGRVQVLPSRFNDSVLENWKKESKSSVQGGEFEKEVECSKDKFVFQVPKTINHTVKSKKNKEKPKSKNVKYSALYEEEEEEKEGDDYYDDGKLVNGYNSFDMRKRLSSYSRSTLTSLHQQPSMEDEKHTPIAERLVQGENHEKKDGLYGPEDFYSGDLVWAKSGKDEPFWPAIVIDPMTQAPELVLRSCVPDAACVMFFGHSGNENERDYAWVRKGMIYPFVDFVGRFQEQPELSGCNPGDFRLALEEAFLAEQGFMEKLMQDINMAAGNPTCDESFFRWVQEATGSNQDPVLHSENEGMFEKNRDFRACEGCGVIPSLETSKKSKALISGDRFFCKTCSRLAKSKHLCGICKKIWNHSDSTSWVRCDGCKVWVHAECDKISYKHFKV